MIMNSIDRRHDEINERNWKNIPYTIKDSKRPRLYWDLQKISGTDDPFIDIKCRKLNEFKTDYLLSPYQDIIDRMINEVSKVYNLLYNNSLGNGSDHTNYLAKFSDNYGLVYEKRISSDYEANRFTYRIAKPIPKKSGSKVYLQIYVDLLGCSYHKINNKGGGSITFSDKDEDNFWMNKSLSELDW